MKYIEKSRLETFLKFKGCEVDSSVGEKVNTSSWCKLDAEKVTIPKKDIFQSNDLPGILEDTDLLKEFRKH